MTHELERLFAESAIKKSPTLRAAYSDRTAWLMASMSELAYFKFEGEVSFADLAKEFAAMSDSSDIQQRLRVFLDNQRQGQSDPLQTLKDVLHVAGFEYLSSYDVAGTQAFMARRLDGSMRLIAFRGTEVALTDLTDVKTDLKAQLVPGEGDEKVHQGFLEGFNRVRDQILADLKKFGGESPLYITGHSLGGALAILCTRYLGHDSHGACYTFGGPRVGNLMVAEKIKTPIYRVVNAADIVPRLPPAWILSVFIRFLKWFPIPGATTIANLLEPYRGYAHFGDMRYFRHSSAGADEDFPGLKLLSNPSFPLRLTWVIQRWLSTWGKAAASDHSIALYRKKLRAYAIRRNPQ